MKLADYNFKGYVEEFGAIGLIGVCLLAAVIIVGFIAACCAVNAFVLMTLWGWFMVKLGLPAIGLAHAVGLSLVYQSIHHKTVYKDLKMDGKTVFFSTFLVKPAFLLGIGWILKDLI